MPWRAAEADHTQKLVQNALIRELSWGRGEGAGTWQTLHPSHRIPIRPPRAELAGAARRGLRAVPAVARLRVAVGGEAVALTELTVARGAPCVAWSTLLTGEAGVVAWTVAAFYGC